MAGSADDYAEAAGDTFLTESKTAPPRASSVQPADDGKQGVSQIQASVEPETQANTSFIGAQQSYLTGVPGAMANSLLQSTHKKDADIN